MSIEDIIKGLEPDLEEIKKNLEAAVLDYTEDNDVRRMLLEAAGNTGKMIRPLFMLFAAGEYEREDRQELISSAVGLEMVHNSSLILDDMIDASTAKGQIRKFYGISGNKYWQEHFICGKRPLV